jgi:hypothetical protein
MARFARWVMTHESFLFEAMGGLSFRSALQPDLTRRTHPSKSQTIAIAFGSGRAAEKRRYRDCRSIDLEFHGLVR